MSRTVKRCANPVISKKGVYEMKEVNLVEKNGVLLMNWQAQMGDQFTQNISDKGGNGTYTCVAAPNSGKTIAAAHCMKLAQDNFETKRYIVVVPSVLIKDGWPEDLSIFGLALSKNITNDQLVRLKIDPDLDGFVVTYQQVGMFPELYRRLVHDQNSMVVFDEVHHLGSNLSWGAACSNAFEFASIKLCLSGTPFRSDGQEIPFLEYEQ